MPAKPYLWAPFEKSIKPSSLGIVRSWDHIENMQYSANEGVGGSGCAKAMDSSGTWTLMTQASDFAWNDYNHQMYLFRKTKRNFDVGNMNWKVWRLWAAGNTYPNAYINTGKCCGNVAAEGIDVAGGYINVDKTVGPINVFFTEEIILRSNSNASTADGYFAFYTNGVLGVEIPYTDYSRKVWKMKDNSSHGSAPMVMNYVVHGVKANTTFPSNYRYWADDIYLDKTWARVMIGDASKWAASSHKEPQIPSVWANGNITVTVNTGTFTADQQVYLYVVDSTGAVNSNGYPITIGRNTGSGQSQR